MNKLCYIRWLDHFYITPTPIFSNLNEKEKNISLMTPPYCFIEFARKSLYLIYACAKQAWLANCGLKFINFRSPSRVVGDVRSDTLGNKR